MQPGPAAPGAELVTEYVAEDLTVLPGGVAYTHPDMGYQAVNLGFGMEFMIGDLLPNGHYTTGADDRVDFMANIMEYFGKVPMAPPTGVDESVFVNRLGHARPNPFNPTTTVEYTVAAPGRVKIRVFDVAGRVMRTLVDSHVAAGRRTAVWDGTTDTGQRAASGVYFVRMEASGQFNATRKLGTTEVRLEVT